MEKINIKDLMISYLEKFDDYIIYCPWDKTQYITKIGDFTVGFGENPFLRGALKDIEKKYGKEIGVSLIETKPIPELSEPIVRRHGKLKVKITRIPISDKDLLYVENKSLYSADWENITGDENSSKNRNEPELWRPIYQRPLNY